MTKFLRLGASVVSAGFLLGAVPAPSAPATAPATATAAATTTRKSPLVGEKIPSEDPLLKDFHSLGLLEGRVNVFRGASPTRDLVKNKAIPEDLAPLQKLADERFARLAALGIRTVVSLENPESPEEPADKAQQALWMALERDAAGRAGITLISHPMINAGAGSMETMKPEEVVRLIDPIATEVLAKSKDGGVLFHCAAGHDRTGVIAAYLRLKWQQWPVEQAIDEMRRLGHNWVKYSGNGGESSWHESQLRAIAEMLRAK